jgi:hypothetical protein
MLGISSVVLVAVVASAMVFKCACVRVYMGYVWVQCKSWDLVW